MSDHVMESFLRWNLNLAQSMTQASDLVEVIPAVGDPPWRYVVRFGCKGIVRRRSGAIVEAEQFDVGVSFMPNHLRGPVDSFATLTWLAPLTIFHPNIACPFICAGRMTPGIDLQAIAFQVYELITYQRFATADCLNLEASEWVRTHLDRLPVDPRPLKWKAPVAREVLP